MMFLLDFIEFSDEFSIQVNEPGRSPVYDAKAVMKRFIGVITGVWIFHHFTFTIFDELRRIKTDSDHPMTCKGSVLFDENTTAFRRVDSSFIFGDKIHAVCFYTLIIIVKPLPTLSSGF